jgi:hypothetical protein
LPQRVNRVVISHRQIAQDSTPEINVYFIALGCDRNLHLLDSPTVSMRFVRLRKARNGPRQFNMLLPKVAR